MNRAEVNKDNLKTVFADADTYLKNVMQKLNIEEMNDFYEYEGSDEWND